MKKKTYLLIVILSIAVLAIFSCGGDNYSPKPRGYFRIDFPEKSYQTFNEPCPYRFDYPVYANAKPDSSRLAEPCWYDLVMPRFRGRVHITYRDITNNMAEQLEDSRTLAYKHTIKADAILENVFVDEEKDVYGILYDIRGNAASQVQFFLTDSTKHFLRGALYFNVKPNKDSLAPVIDFLKEDIIHLIETFEWNENQTIEPEL